MASMPVYLSEDIRLLTAAQSGAIARWQAPSVGLDTTVIDAQLRLGRWQPLYRGVYAAFTGPPPRLCFLWGAELRAGPGAVLSYYSAAELDGLTDLRADAIHVAVPPGRQILVSRQERGAGAPVVAVHRSARLALARHPVRLPPRTRIEETVLDLVQASTGFDGALSWLISACARRRATPVALQAAIQARPRMRWRAALAGALEDIGNGIHSVLEYRYARAVERPHGLPAARRQARVPRGARSHYLDNLYADFGVAVELDGRAAHRAEDRWADTRRDNFFAGVGIVTLRYGWADVTERPCQVAAEVGRVLRERGRTGTVARCGPACGC
jgi:very-short-patch-repair endonuclease